MLHCTQHLVDELTLALPSLHYDVVVCASRWDVSIVRFSQTEIVLALGWTFTLASSVPQNAPLTFCCRHNVCKVYEKFAFVLTKQFNARVTRRQTFVFLFSPFVCLHLFDLNCRKPGWAAGFLLPVLIIFKPARSLIGRIVFAERNLFLSLSLSDLQFS